MLPVSSDPRTHAMKTSHPRFAELRDRLVLAAMGALPALSACGDPPTPSHAVAGTGSAVAAASTPRDPMTLPAAPSASTVAPAASTPPTSNVIPRSPPADCFSPFSGARSIGTGGPGPKAPDTAYDKNGCLPYSMVSNGCCNGATAGPRFEDGFCCYTIPTGPCCGRPFTVDGEARTAPIAVSEAWMSNHVPAEGRAPHPEAQRWLADARMEHASVASFARFVLDLLAIGAPAHLVRSALRAQGDEIVHAVLCFDVAARGMGASFGPGPLDVASTHATSRSLAAIVHDAVVEGCVGESLAAEVARDRLANETEPLRRAALTRIAADEARHAELAWAFVRWVVEREGAVAEAWVEAALDGRRPSSERLETKALAKCG